MLDRMTLSPGAWPATLPRPARVREVIVENYRTRSLVLDLDLAAQPGQFVMVWLPGLDEKPYSLAGITPLTLTITEVGRFSRALHELGPGDRLGIRGPFGQGFSPQGRRALLVGGGYGAAPLAFLARALQCAGLSVTVALGAACAAELILLDHFWQLGIDPCVSTDDGSQGRPGQVTALVQEILARQPVDALYACGPNGMIDALEQISADAGIPSQLSREAYMRCGLGICGSCEHDGQLVCRDGPVFYRAGLAATGALDGSGLRVKDGRLLPAELLLAA